MTAQPLLNTTSISGRSLACSSTAWSIALSIILCTGSTGDAAKPTVHFDLLPVATATPTEPYSTLDSEQSVRIDFDISSLVSTMDDSSFDQWTVQIVPRGDLLYVTDYAPQTESASDLASDIDFKKTEEQSYSIGLSAGTSFGPIAHGKAGVDHQQKSLETTQYQRRAPRHVVTASGTIRHGRGVYFKLRSSSQQTLEGQKRFSVSFRVPPHWRANLVDVWVSAQRKTRSLPGFPTEIRNAASQHFVVAVHHVNDAEAKTLAWELASAEQDLRVAANQHVRKQKAKSLPAILHHYVTLLDEPFASRSKGPSQMEWSGQPEWLDRLLAHQTNPYNDRQINKLPVELRVIAIHYCDSRSLIEKLSCY